MNLILQRIAFISDLVPICSDWKNSSQKIFFYENCIYSTKRRQRMQHCDGCVFYVVVLSSQHCMHVSIL